MDVTNSHQRGQSLSYDCTHNPFLGWCLHHYCGCIYCSFLYSSWENNKHHNRPHCALGYSHLAQACISNLQAGYPSRVCATAAGAPQHPVYKRVVYMHKSGSRTAQSAVPHNITPSGPKLRTQQSTSNTSQAALLLPLGHQTLIHSPPPHPPGKMHCEHQLVVYFSRGHSRPRITRARTAAACAAADGRGGGALQVKPKAGSMLTSGGAPAAGMQQPLLQQMSVNGACAAAFCCWMLFHCCQHARCLHRHPRTGCVACCPCCWWCCRCRCGSC